MTSIEQYDYDLPKEQIAQHPTQHRADARMLVVNRAAGTLTHAHVRDLADYLAPPDVLLLNDTRVVPARLVGYRESTKGRWTGLYLDCDATGCWKILCKARGRLTPGENVVLLDRDAKPAEQLSLVARCDDGSWIVKPKSSGDASDILDRIGRVPLPHYIRGGEMVDADQKDYQTIYASTPGAVAAPTAGLHFTQDLLGRIKAKGVDLCPATLHVGVGTFRPITTDSIEQHEMHEEWGTISEETIDRLTACRAAGGRIVAIGTTSVRLAETSAREGSLQPWTGMTDLYIHPPYEFRAVDVLLTNFHVPRSSLLVLVRTFGGDALIRQAYDEAVGEEYRFFSYGDAMLIV